MTMILLRPAYLVVGLRGVARLDLVDAIQTTAPEAEICLVDSVSDLAMALSAGVSQIRNALKTVRLRLCWMSTRGASPRYHVAP